MRKKNNIPVILFGDYIAAYGVIRALGPLNIPIYLVSSHSRQNLCRYSRYVKENVVIPTEENDAFLESIIQWGKTIVGEEAVLIIAGSDEPLDILPSLIQELPLGWKPTFPDVETVQKVREKERTYKIAESIGIPVPRTFCIKQNEDFQKFKEEIENWVFPVLVKAEDSKKFLEQYKTKGVLFENRSELEGIDNFFSIHPNYQGAFLLQEFIPGPEKNLWNYIGVFDDSSIPISFFLNRKIRSSAQFLSCTLMESFYSETVVVYSNSLIKEIGYLGYANMEYKLDPRDGSLRLMEINGRVSMSNSHALRCGINLPFAMYKNALGEAHNHFEAKQTEVYSKKILWWFPLGDLKFVFTSLLKKDLSIANYFKDLKGDGYIIEPFSLGDPVPGIYHVLRTFAGFIMKVIRKLWRNSERKKLPEFL